ncbi:hepatic triacylglycerol lipase isoform X2 [Cervus elaphus]|uniref:hepatic triacylglycerol lipase isoform X2 n=1 Tax=Cervus canadensis TaxID=1574408 RepID=UPI001C9E8F2D|nr:hepatic triacylglycerol lipase isoform X2 [Cervus canadensis]XP_043776355.1 hepatic triacylglycerol lipase isoform X2 [Cervus elaphus]
MENPLCVSIFLFLCILIQSSAHGQSLGTESFGRRSRAAETNETLKETRTRFLLFRGETDKGCQIRLTHSDTLQQCGFNSSLPLVMIVHGWLVDGILEDWVWEMVAALKSHLAQPVNVGLAEWVTLAHNHYTTAVRNTRLVGQEIAALLQWLQESVQFSPSHVHLIGYSLGAHVSGFAGSYMSRKHKIGRITGLDAAGPLFEKASLSDRLSPDDASFVDAIHTFTWEHMGLSVGIKQPIAHYDFYPNGGSYQPGCHFLELYKHFAKHGLNVYHYQFKIRFINQTENSVEPTFTVSFLGTRGERQKIPITLSKGITSNETYSFLITLDVDIGELIMIKFKWENSMVWSNVWNTVQTIIPWGRESLHSGLALKSIRVKVGETQQRMTFCSENMNDLQLHPAQEKTFVRCEANSETLKQKIR